MGGAGEEVGCSVGCPSAGGAEPIRGPADPLQICLEGRAEPRTQLGKGGAVGTGQSPLLLRHNGRLREEDSVWGTGSDSSEDVGGVEVLNCGFETIGGKDTIGEVGPNCRKETGLEGAADVSGARGTGGDGVGGY